MKKTFKFTSVVVFLMGFVFSSQAQVSFGVKAGLNMYTLNQSLEDDEDDSALNYRPGFHIGAVVDYPINESLSLKTGLNFITKGTNVDLESVFKDQEDVTIEGSSYLGFAYLELPIHLDYRKNKFHLFGGPYLGFGVAGRAVSDYSISGGSSSFEVDDKTTLNPSFGEVNEDDFEEDEDAFNALDLGLNLGVGYEVGPVLISVDYSLGFGNIIPTYEGEDDSEDKLTNSGINLSVSHMF